METDATLHTTELPYHLFLDTPWINLQPVRAFDQWQVWSAGTDGYFLILDETEERRATLIQYETRAERDQEIKRVRRLPAPGDTGNAGAPSPAWLKPVPPTRTARDAKPLPKFEG